LPKHRLGIEDRKSEGLHIPIKEDVQARKSTTLLENVTLIHDALPDINFKEINLSTTFLKHKLSAPILIDAMTGGTIESKKINSNLASAAEELGIAMGVGSQRAGLESRSLAESYIIARKKAPSIFLIANIGGVQLIDDFDLKKIQRIIDMIEANALAIHLNPLQELIQPEGEPRFLGILEKISDLAINLNIPVIIKEVGCGLSHESASKLDVSNIDAINIAGAGGTSWAAIEHFRAKQKGDEKKAELGKLFWDWGIPTAASILEVKQGTNLPIIASGGIRTGLDICKCIAMGASIVGMAYPFLIKAMKSKKEVVSLLNQLQLQIKSTMFVTGNLSIRDLSKTRYIVTGKLFEWERSLNSIRY
jgi:isopentenyl-diphosphate delta-isomerase